MKPFNLSYSPERSWVGKFLSMVLLMVLLTGMAFAQQKTISGKVIDETGAPVTGATIVVKGTTVGTVTDLDGKFSIGVPAAGKVLLVSFIGMKSEEITIGNQTNISVKLISETIGINEVVAIGYSSASRKNVASSIAKISDKDIVGLSVSDVRQTLQGKMAGVQVTSPPVAGFTQPPMSLPFWPRAIISGETRKTNWVVPSSAAGLLAVHSGPGPPV